MIGNLTQTQFVLQHLQTHGYITDLVAQNYGIKRLASRIHEVRRAGFPVNREYRRDEAGTRYAYYTPKCPLYAGCTGCRRAADQLMGRASARAA